MNPSYDRMRRLECIQETFTTTPCAGTVSQMLLALIKVVPIGAHMSLHHCAKTASWSERVRAWARAICIALASTVVCAVGVAGDVKAQTSNFSVSQPRTVTVLNKQAWRFIQDDNLTDAAALSSDASTWSTVQLPHTWNAIDAATTEQKGPTSQNYKRGLGWYRLEFDNPGTSATQWLQFDGASIVADVWLNGQKLGQHKGAFTAFRFDVTGKLLTDQKNVLLVKTDNRAASTNSDPTAIAPLSGDFNMSGGLYRSVSVVSTLDKVHFALNDLGSSGIFARTSALGAGTATVNVRAKVENDGAAGGIYLLWATLLEADGRTIKSSAISKITVNSQATAERALDVPVQAPHLWQGLEDPYLYTLVVELKDAHLNTLDAVVHNFGIRTMTFDPNLGFFLNGQSTPLRGVDMHQDYYHKAWAIDPANTDESFAIIDEIGANTLRLAHYPHAQYTLDHADALGVVVWAEVPFVNSSTVCVVGSTGFACPGDPEATGFAANVRQQLQELIRQQYNHPSIGLWSIGNEMTIIPIIAGQTNANNNIQPLLRSLQALAKAEDPSRVTTLAQEGYIVNDAVIEPPPVEAGSIADTYSVNRYFLWYYGTGEGQFGQDLDTLHALYPTKPLGISEYGGGAALTHHTDNPKGGRVCSRDATGARRICYQPEEYASDVHEVDYATIAARPYLFGTFVWNMFDFGSGIRHEGDIGATNTKGLVTFDRKTRKDPFFLYKANWSSEPVTYITGRRYTERAYPVADVTLYHNGQAVTLTVNGTPVGTLTAAQCPLKACKFANVPLHAGANMLVAQGTHGGSSVTDTVTWNLSADNANNVYIAAGQLTTGFQSSDPLLGSHRYGSDNFFTAGTPVTLAPLTVINGIGSAAIPDTGRVWDAYREGSAFGYRIPVANGNYRVTLGFLEPTATAAGQRFFNVSANGTLQIANLDILGAAGAQNTAIARTFLVTVSNGVLALDFTGVAGNAILSNIAAVKQ
jgi:beta-galactosidase